jgi:hypothetical protein
LQNVIRTRFPNSKAGLENLFLRGFLLKEITMRKITSLLLITALTACGGGTVEPPKPQIVKLSAEAIAQLPPGFTIGPTASGIPPGPFVAGPAPSTTPPPVEFVVGPSGTVPSPVVIGPTPTVPFVAGPVAGPVVTVSPPVVIGPSRITQPVINYCTDGFVVGPCTPLPTTCRPDTNGFVVGPCGN